MNSHRRFFYSRMLIVVIIASFFFIAGCNKSSSGGAFVPPIPPGPNVGAISPDHGPAAGGTNVTITGTNFTTINSLTFGGVDAVNPKLVSETTITATTPAGVAGDVVNVVINCTGGTTTVTNGFSYDGPPTITAVTPSTGPVGGGSFVTITGTMFFNMLPPLPALGAVTIGGNNVNYTVNSISEITFTTPAGAGPQPLFVTTNLGVANSTFTYVNPATITDFNPKEGTSFGGTLVTVDGTNFNTETKVKFGSNYATDVQLDSVTPTTKLTCRTPAIAGRLNPVSVSVENSGTPPDVHATKFNYLDSMYWTVLDTGTNDITSLYRGTFNGGSIAQLFLRVHGEEIGMAVDSVAGMMYWTDQGLNNIRRATLDGYSVTTILTGLSSPAGIDLDIAGGKMYWAEVGSGSIKRADMTGANVETLITGLSTPQGVALDVVGGKMYWTEAVSRMVRRANLDGSSVENPVTTGLSAPRGIALDLGLAPQKMFWTDSGHARITRANLDGSNIEEIYQASGDSLYRGIAADPVNHYIYWTDAAPGLPPRVYSALDTANPLVTTIIAQVPPNPDPTKKRSLWGIDLDVANSRLYYTEPRSDLETANSGHVWGAGFVPATGQPTGSAGILVPSFPINPYIEIDTAGGKIYWSYPESGSIHRANLDTSSPEVVVSDSPNYPTDIVLDTRPGTLWVYWLEPDPDPLIYDGRILRSDISGALPGAVEEVVAAPNVEECQAIALDFLTAGNRVYWTEIEESTPGQIKYASLVGPFPAGTTTVISDPLTFNPGAIAIGRVDGKFYYQEGGTIYRANLDGSVIDTLVSDAAINIDVDMIGGKMYWTSAGSVKRASRDGTNVETVVSGITDIFDIALETPNWTRSSLTAKVVSQGTLLEWKDLGCDGVVGYNLWRGEKRNGQFVRITSTPMPTGQFAYVDTSVEACRGNRFYYKLEAVCASGGSFFLGLEPVPNK